MYARFSSHCTSRSSGLSVEVLQEILDAPSRTPAVSRYGALARGGNRHSSPGVAVHAVVHLRLVEVAPRRAFPASSRTASGTLRRRSRCATCHRAIALSMSPRYAWSCAHAYWPCMASSGDSSGRASAAGSARAARGWSGATRVRTRHISRRSWFQPSGFGNAEKHGVRFVQPGDAEADLRPRRWRPRPGRGRDCCRPGTTGCRASARIFRIA